MSDAPDGSNTQFFIKTVFYSYDMEMKTAHFENCVFLAAPSGNIRRFQFGNSFVCCGLNTLWLLAVKILAWDISKSFSKKKKLAYKECKPGGLNFQITGLFKENINET